MTMLNKFFKIEFEVGGVTGKEPEIDPSRSGKHCSGRRWAKLIKTDLIKKIRDILHEQLTNRNRKKR